MPMYWVNTEGTLLGANLLVLQALGLSSYRDIIGKKIHDFHPKEVADHIVAHNLEVMRIGQSLSQEEWVKDFTTGEIRYFSAVKTPLYDNKFNVVGMLGTAIEITAEKEAERLRTESERQQVALQEKENFALIARKVAHDISSPLQALTSMLNLCHELPEEKRTALRKSLNNAIKILYSLANHYKNDPNQKLVESRQNLLIANYVTEVVEEKEYQYINHHHPIDFELIITEPAKMAYIDAQASQLCRSLSNIINNAIDALPDTKAGVIQVLLDADEKKIDITVSDNGNGMTPEAVQKIQNRTSFTENKTDGHGLGLQQVWDMLEFNRGKIKVTSILGQGTTVQFTFQRSKPANWQAQEIVLRPNTILLIIDDEKLMHLGWELKLGSIVRQHPEIQVKYFEEGDILLSFVRDLTDEERTRVLLLADYELPYQKINGLQVIVDSSINNAILITGHSSNSDVRKAAMDLGIELLPKQLLSEVPLRYERNFQNAA